MSRWLVVVWRDRLALYRFLWERLEEVPGVAVLVDTREADRRRQTVPSPVERRRRERRGVPPLRDREHWSGLGFLLVRING